MRPSARLRGHQSNQVSALRAYVNGVWGVSTPPSFIRFARRRPGVPGLRVRRHLSLLAPMPARQAVIPIYTFEPPIIPAAVLELLRRGARRVVPTPRCRTCRQPDRSRMCEERRTRLTTATIWPINSGQELSCRSFNPNEKPSSATDECIVSRSLESSPLPYSILLNYMPLKPASRQLGRQSGVYLTCWWPRVSRRREETSLEARQRAARTSQAPLSIRDAAVARLKDVADGNVDIPRRRVGSVGSSIRQAVEAAKSPASPLLARLDNNLP